MDRPDLLVGRRLEVSRMERALDAASGGQGEAILIHGEAGIGKSRLLAETSERAARRGFLVLDAQCQEAENGVPYAPWITFLRGLVRIAPKRVVRAVLLPRREVVVRLVPEFGDLIWLHDPEGHRAPELGATAFREAVAEVFFAVADNQPLLMQLDDLGWADRASLDLWAAIARGCVSHCICLTAAYRDSQLEENPTLGAFLAKMGTSPHLTLLVPARLDESQVGTLIRARCALPEVGRGLRRAVWSRTAGNPFFVIELLRSLEQAGLLPASLRKDSLPAGLSAVPQSLRVVVRQHLDRLDAEGRMLLGTAALLGLTFRADLLEKVLGVGEERMVQGLEFAQRAHLIVPATAPIAGESYTFAHPLIQDVLATEMSAPRARRVHRRAAMRLEEESAGDDELSASLAYHFLRAGQWKPALDYSVRAARYAARIFAAADSASHYRTALSVLETHPDPRVSADILESLSGQLTLLGDYAGAVRCLIEAAEIQESAGNQIRAGALKTQAALYGPWTYREFRSIEDQLKAARSVLEAAAPSRELAQLYIEHANVLSARLKFDQADRLLQQALELGARLQDYAIQAEAHLAKGQLVPVGGKQSCLIELTTALEQCHRRAGSLEFRALHCLAMLAAYGRGDLREVDHCTNRVSELDNEASIPQPPQAVLGRVGAFAALLRGDVAKSRRLAEEFQVWLRAKGQPEDCQNLLVLARLAALEGDVEKSAGLIERARDCFLEEEGWFSDPWIWLRQGELESARGDSSAAIKAFGQGLRSYRRRGRLEIDALVEVWLSSGLIAAAARTLDLETATAELEELRTLARALAIPVAEGYALRSAAEIASARGDGVAAVEHLTRSQATWATAGWKLELLHDLESLARAQVRLGHPGDARSLRLQARELRRESGLGAPHRTTK